MTSFYMHRGDVLQNLQLSWQYEQIITSLLPFYSFHYFHSLLMITVLLWILHQNAISRFARVCFFFGAVPWSKVSYLMCKTDLGFQTWKAAKKLWLNPVYLLFQSEVAWPSFFSISYKTVHMTNSLLLLFTDTFICVAFTPAYLFSTVCAFIHVSVNVHPSDKVCML